MIQGQNILWVLSWRRQRRLLAQSPKGNQLVLGTGMAVMLHLPGA